MSNAQIRSLARRLGALERDRLLRKQPSLAHSSIDDGAVQATDVDGNTTMVIGQQFDGTNTAATLVGPTPPTPIGALVTPVGGGLKAYWDGTYEDAALPPMDFARVTIHAVPTTEFLEPDPVDQTRIVGFITSATGGEVTFSTSRTEHVVYLVAWSQAGKPSLASAPVTAAPLADLGTPIGVPDAPEVILSGTNSTINVEIQGFTPDMEVAYYIGTTADFAIGPATLYAKGRSPMMVITNLADGGTLDLGSTYYVRAVLSNQFGTSEASQAIPATLNPDIVPVSAHGRINGTLELRSGIVRPEDGPALTYSWPRVDAAALGNGSSDNGFIYNGMAPHLTDNWKSVVGIAYFGGGIRVLDHRTGSISSFPDPTNGKAWCSGFNIIGGIATDAPRGVYYVLGQDTKRNNDYYIYAINGSFDKVGEAYFWNTANVSTFYPKIAFHDTKLYVAWSHTDNKIRLRTITPSGNSSAVTFANAGGTSPVDVIMETLSGRIALADLEVGIFDSPTSTPHVVYRPADSSSFRTRLLSNAASGSSELAPFISPATKVRGFRWITGSHGPRLIAYDDWGMIYYFSDLRSNTTVRATQSWFDPKSDTADWAPQTPNATGTHETEESESYRESVIQARSWVAITNDAAPDETNSDPSNPDKATASRAYAAVGTAQRVLQGTLGKSTRTQSVGVYGDAGYERQLWAHETGGLQTFSTDDIGAAVTGGGLPAGTTIVDVPAQYGGQLAVLSQNHGLSSAYITVTVARSQYGRKLKLLPSLATGTKVPESTNGFLGATITPGRFKSYGPAPVIDLWGPGNGKAGPYEWDADGKSLAPHVSLLGSHTPAVANTWYTVTNGTAESGNLRGDITVTSGQIVIQEEGVYDLSLYARQDGSVAGRRIASIWLAGTTAAAAATGSELTRADINITPVNSVGLTCAINRHLLPGHVIRACVYGVTSPFAIVRLVATKIS